MGRDGLAHLVRVERCINCRFRWDCSAGKAHSVAWRRVHCPQWASLSRAPIPLRAVPLTSATLPCPRGSWVRHQWHCCEPASLRRRKPSPVFPASPEKQSSTLWSLCSFFNLHCSTPPNKVVLIQWSLVDRVVLVMLCFVVSSPVSGCMAFRLQNLNPVLVVRKRMLHLGCCFTLLLRSYMKSLLPAQPPAVLLWCSIEMLIKPPQERAESSKRKIKRAELGIYYHQFVAGRFVALLTASPLFGALVGSRIGNRPCLLELIGHGQCFSFTVNSWTVFLGVKNRAVACIPRLVCTYMAFTHTKLKHSVI